MKHSFGKPEGVAVQIKPGQEIFRIACNEENLVFIRKILTMAKKKLPGNQKINIRNI